MSATPPAERVLELLGTSAGGVGRHVRALAGGLVAGGARVVVAGPAEVDAAFGFAAAGLRFRPVRISDRPRPGDACTLVGLRGLLAGVDAVHAHGLRAGALAVLAARTRRHRPAVVVTLHNAPVGGGRAALVAAGLERLVARGADEVLVVSGDLGDRIGALGARHVRRALVPAPDRLRDRPSGRPPAAVRAELGVPASTALLVCAARLATQKGLPLLADSLAVLAREHPQLAVLAVVAGEGPLRAALQADAEARGLPLRLLGARDDVPDLFAAADLVLSPSVWEGQPLAVQEALRAGAAVVATRVGGTAEVTGEAAELVPAGDPGALARAVAALLTDPHRRSALQAAARSRAALLPTEADAVAQVREVLESAVRRVVRGRRPRALLG